MSIETAKQTVNQIIYDNAETAPAVGEIGLLIRKARYHETQLVGALSCIQELFETLASRFVQTDLQIALLQSQLEEDVPS